MSEQVRHKRSADGGNDLAVIIGFKPLGVVVLDATA
jgi:hypothetical protein